MKLILFGYYGFGNVGDEKCLDQTVRLIKSLLPHSSFIVAKGAYSLPFDSFNRWNIFRWILELRSANAMVMGGGSIFQTKTSFASLFYYLFIILLARFLRCQVILLCHGWGPFKYNWHQQLARLILKNCNRSWRTAKNPFSNDPVFCDLTLFEPLQEFNHNQGETIGVSIRTLNKKNDLQTYLYNHNKPVLLIENQYGLTTSENHVFLDTIWNLAPKDLALVITDRFHTAIWACRNGIRWVSVSDDPKLTDLATSVGMPNWGADFDIDQINLSALKSNKNIIEWVKKEHEKHAFLKEWLYGSLTA